MPITRPNKKSPSFKTTCLKYGLYAASIILVVIFLIYSDKNANTIKNPSLNDGNSDNAPAVIQPLTEGLMIMPTPVKITVDNVYYKTYFVSLTEDEKEKITRLNELLFNLVNTPSNEAFEHLLSQGYPNKSELNFISLHQFDEVSIMLLNNKIENYLTPSETPINENALRVLNFVNTVYEIEKIISYYHTGFTFSAGENPNTSWSNSNDKMPSQVREALASLVYANAALSTETGMELLAKAKFEEMMSYWNNEEASNNESLFKYLSAANKQLPVLGIDDYVKFKFPEKYEEYLTLSSRKDE